MDTHHVQILDDAEEALQMLTYFIRTARQTIDVQYFIIHQGATARMFLGLLSEAANRGVRVRILLDGMGSRLRPGLQGYLIHHTNIALRFYHSASVRHPERINRRLHGKLLLVDKKHLISGGRNIGDKFFGKHGPVLKRLYLDRDLYIHATSLHGVPQQVHAYFEKLWSSNHVSPSPIYKKLAGGMPKTFAIRVQKHERAIHQELTTARVQQPHLFIDLKSRLKNIHAVTRIHFVHDPIGSKNEYIGTTKALYNLFSRAQKSILGQSPYIIATPRLIESFLKAQKNGARITLLTNSIASSPNILAIATHEHYKRALAETGINLTEYTGTYNLHHKSYIIDNKISVVGTFNLDPRSARSNTELLYVIEDRVFATTLKKSIQNYSTNTQRAAHASIRRKLSISVCRVFAPLLKKLV